jgi:hypothetical protein
MSRKRGREKKDKKMRWRQRETYRGERHSDRQTERKRKG